MDKVGWLMSGSADELRSILPNFDNLTDSPDLDPPVAHLIDDGQPVDEHVQEPASPSPAELHKDVSHWASPAKPDFIRLESRRKKSETATPDNCQTVQNQPEGDRNCLTPSTTPSQPLKAGAKRKLGSRDDLPPVRRENSALKSSSQSQDSAGSSSHEAMDPKTDRRQRKVVLKPSRSKSSLMTTASTIRKPLGESELSGACRKM